MNELWMIFSSQDQAGVVVNLIIVGLFAYALFEILLGADRLRVEHKNIAQIRAALQGKPDAQAVAQGLTTALDLLPDGLFRRRITRIMDLRKAGLGHRDVLQQLTMEGVSGYGAHARFIATILTVIGLVGTVVGMSLAMLRISGAFHGVGDAHALTELMKSLGGTLQGMKTAFGCTLAGLVAAVIVGSAAHFLRRWQSRVIREIEEFVTCELLPALERIDPEADNAAKSFVSAITDAADKLSALGNAMAASGKEYKEAGSKYESAVQALDQAMVKFSTAASKLEGNQEKFVQAMEATRKAIKKQNLFFESRLDSLKKTSEKQETLQKTIAKYHEDFSAMAKEAANNSDKATKELLKTIGKHYQDAVKGHIDENQAALRKIIQEHSDKLQSFSDLILDVYIQGRTSSQSMEGRA
jgi:biopolymer transport protein ExbB/TolQ/uncharacterized protein YukE